MTGRKKSIENSAGRRPVQRGDAELKRRDTQRWDWKLPPCKAQRAALCGAPPYVRHDKTDENNSNRAKNAVRQSKQLHRGGGLE